MWVNRKGRYPYITRDAWSTRAWLLVRKDPKTASAAARRVAAMLFEVKVHDPRGKPLGVMEILGEWINGYEDSHPAIAAPGAAGAEAPAHLGPSGLHDHTCSRGHRD
jgi:hypothetical protein